MSDYEYRPRLKTDDLTPGHNAYLTAWRIPDTSQVLAVEDRRLSLLWHGEFRGGETPVFATLVSTHQVVPNKLREWFCGVALEDEVQGSSDPLLAYLDAAKFASPTLPETFVLLACLAPLERASI